MKAVSGADRDAALSAIHAALEANKEAILAANQKDMSAALGLVSQGKLSQSLVKRLDLSKAGKWEDMLSGILQVRSLPDPVGKITLATKLDNGLDLYRVTSPIGVLLVIFEGLLSYYLVSICDSTQAFNSGRRAVLKLADAAL